MKKTYNYWRYAVMANKKVNKFANTNTVKTTENKSAETVVPAAAPVEAKAAAPEVKTPVEAKAEVKTEAEKEEKKPAAKKAPAKKEEAPAEKAVKKAPEKDTAKLFIEFGGNKFAADEIVEKCKAAYKADNSRKQVRSIEVYVKPEDNKAYYVVNGKADGLYIDL
jgi:hypothetical protein